MIENWKSQFYNGLLYFLVASRHLLWPHKQLVMIDGEASIEELIIEGESNIMEFKASMRWDYAAGQRGANDMGQLAILKTIAAFMNSEGGTLFAGVVDNGNILGIEKDFETFSDRKNWDGWQQHPC